MRASNLIPDAFKKCGLANDCFGRENHLLSGSKRNFRVIEVQHLLSYKVPEKEHKRVPEPYMAHETEAFFEAEIRSTKSKNRKRELEKNPFVI